MSLQNEKQLTPIIEALIAAQLEAEYLTHTSTDFEVTIAASVRIGDTAFLMSYEFPQYPIATTPEEVQSAVKWLKDKR